MKKHAPVIANLRELAKVSADMHSREPTDQLEWEAADLLQLYSDALVRLGDIKPLPTKDITGRKQVYVDLEARIEYAQTTVEAGYIEEHAEITKEQWDSIKTTVEGE